MNPYSRVEYYTLDEMNDSIITDFATEVLIGPQAEIITMCNNIENESPWDYRRNVRRSFKPEVTKTFRWKPGTYNKVKEYWTYLLGWEKSNNMRLFFNRMGTNGDMEWYRNKFKRNMKALDRRLCELRTNGIKWQDNTDDVINIWDDICNHIAEQSEYMPAMIIPYDRDSNILYNDIKMEITLYYPSTNLHIWNNNADMLGVIPMEGCGISIQINFMKLINGLVSIKPEDRFNLALTTKPPVKHDYSKRFYNIGAIYLGHDNLVRKGHPFISRGGGVGDSFIDYANFDVNHRTINENSNYRNVCLGDLEGDATSIQLLNLNIADIDNFISQWLSNYTVGHTNPLNGSRQWFHGMPKWWSEQSSDFKRVIGIPDEPRDCYIYQSIANDENDREVKIAECNDIECGMRDNCNMYQEYGNEDSLHIKRQLVAELCNIWSTDLKDLDSPVTFDDLFNCHDARWFEHNHTIVGLNDYIITEHDWAANRITLFKDWFVMKYDILDKELDLRRLSEEEWSKEVECVKLMINSPHFFLKPYNLLETECGELQEERAYLALEIVKNSKSESSLNRPEWVSHIGRETTDEEMMHRLSAMYGNSTVITPPGVNISRGNIHGSEIPEERTSEAEQAQETLERFLETQMREQDNEQYITEEEAQEDRHEESHEAPF